MALLDSKQLNPRLTGSFTLSGSLATQKDTRLVGNITEIIKVTVVSDGGNKYAFEGATAPDFTVDEGKTYRFDLSDSSNSSHPFRFSITENGTHGGGSAYSTGVTVNGTPGQNNSYTEISVTKVTPNNLYYYCTNHSGMGNDALLLKNDFLNLHRVSGSSISTGSFGHLNIAGNTNLVGDLTLGGNIQIGNADTDSITISSDLTSNLTPNADSTYDIGSSAKYWRNAYIDTLTTTGNVSGSSTSTGSFGRVESRGDLYSYGNITTEGDITARQFVVSSSVTTMSIAQASGSTIFGDDSSDNHRFTGSLRVTGSLNVDKGRIFEQGTSVIDHATAMAIVFGG